MRRWLAILASVLAMVCVVIALLRPTWSRLPPATRVAVVADDTVELRTAIAQWRAAAAHGDPFFVVRAGARPVAGGPGEVEVPAGSGAPDLAAALSLAAALVPEHHPGALALWTDGAHVGDELAPILETLTRRGIVLHVRPLPRAAAAARLMALAVPATVREREPFRVTATIESAEAQAATLALRGGERELARATLALRAGTSRYELDVTPPERGMLVLHATLTPASGFRAELHEERAATLVDGRLRALLLSDDDGQALGATLAPHGIDVIRADPSVPLTRQRLAEFDLALVEDLPVTAWPPASQTALRDAVLDDGMGLLLAGARRNLGPGGYADSPLAPILPVEMPAREQRRDPSVALVIVIDTSGSMGGARIELAKEVARLALRRLLPHDKVGIVEFHGAKRWAAPLQPASNLIEVTRALNRLQPGGGTIIYNALEESFYALWNAKTRFKHALILSDGGVESGPFEALARRMAEHNVQVSTVLIGHQSHSPFMTDLAQWGRGRFYACPSRFQLPDLRFKEPQTAPLPGVTEELLPVARAGAHESSAALAGIALNAGALVEARVRDGASLLLTAGGRPYLAGWDQGAGRVQVLCGELLGPTTEELRRHPAYGALLADVVRGLSRTRIARATRLVLAPREATLEVRLENVPSGLRPQLEWQDGGVAHRQPLWPSRDAWATRIDWPAAGVASLQVTANGRGLAIGAAAKPLPQRARAPDSGPMLARLATESGGGDTGPFDARPATTAAPVELQRPLALLALALFVLALLLRRWPPRVAAALLLFAFAGSGGELRAQDDPIAARMRAELQRTGDLGALQTEWAGGTIEQKVALARAGGDLAAALALLPATPAHAAERAQLAAALGRFDVAQAAVEQVLASNLPPLEQAGWLLTRGELQLARGDRAAAAADFERGIAAANQPQFAYRAGYLAGGYGLLDLALAAHRVEYASEAQRFATHLRRASWQEERNALDAAQDELRQALAAARLSRDQRFVLATWARMMRGANRLPELAAEWRQQLAHPETFRALLLLLSELGRAEEVFELLPAAGDREELIAEGLAIALESATSERALALARERLRARPDDLHLRSGLAVLQVDLRRHDEAAQTLRDGLARATRSAELQRLIATAITLNLQPVASAGLAQLRALGPDDALQAVRTEAQWLAQRGQRGDAVALLLGARAQFTEPTQKVRVGEALEALGETAAAAGLYREAYAVTKTEDLALRLGWLLAASKDDKDRQEAMTFLREVWLNAGSEARRVQVEERVLQLAAREGTLADFAIELEDALADPATPNRAAKRMALIKLYARGRDTTGAAAVLDAWGEEPGMRIEALTQRAQMHLENHEYIAYERAVRRLIELDPEHELDYRQQLAACALERGRPALARQIVGEMLAGDAASEVAYEFAAGILTLAARYDDAVRVYRRTLARFPDRIETWLLLGNALRSAGKTERAIGMFAELITQDPPDDLLLVAADGLLNMDASRDYLRFAERAIRRRAAQTPERVHLHRMLQDLLEAQKDEPSRQRALAATVLVAGEQRATFVRERMDEASARGDRKAQVEHGLELLWLGDEVPPDVFLELGSALVQQKDLRGAERAFARARFASDFAGVEKRIAAVYETAGALEDAERVWRRVLRRSPDSLEAMTAVARLCEQRDARAEAFQVWSELAARADAAGDDALDGLLRTAPSDAELAPLRLQLSLGIATAPARERAALLARLRRIANAFGSEAALADLRTTEDAALAAADRDPALAGVLARARLRAGDVEGAEAALAQAPAVRGFDRDRFALHLMRGELAEAAALVEGASARELAEALRALHRAGARDAARALLGRLEAMATSDPDAALSVWSDAARALGQPVDAGVLAERRLRAAEALPAGGKRLTSVLAAVRTGQSLPKERLARALRAVRGEALADPNGNQTQAFVLQAVELLDPPELDPLIEKTLQNLANPILALSRLGPLRVLPPARQQELLERVLGTFEARERGSQRLRMLGQRDLSKELRRWLVETLELTAIAPTDRYAITQLAFETPVDPELTPLLLTKLKALKDDARGHALRARAATDPAERESALRQAAQTYANRIKLEAGEQAIAQSLAGLLPPAALEWPEVAGTREGAIALRAELKRARGDFAGAVVELRTLARGRADDVGLLNVLIGVLEQAGDRDGAVTALRDAVARAPAPMPYQVGRLAQALVTAGRPGEALDALAGVKDDFGQNLAVRIEAIAKLDDPARRAREARAWLQSRSGTQRRGRVGVVSMAVRGATRPFTLAEALRPLGELRRPPVDLEWLGTFAEGAALARAHLRTLDETARDAELAGYRSWLAAARLGGTVEPIVAAASARFDAKPYDAEALRTLFAAAQLGLEVPPAALVHEARRRIATGGGEPAFLAQMLVVARGRGDEPLVRTLLETLLTDRASLQAPALAPFLPAVLAVAAQLAPARLLQLAPGGDDPNPVLDCWLMIATQELDAAASREAFRSVPAWLAGTEPRALYRERLALPWCGIQLRLGDVDAALGALRSIDRIVEVGEGAPPESLAAAIPPLARWPDAAGTARLAEGLRAEAGLTSPRAVLFFRLACVLAVRMRVGGQVEAATALLAELRAKAGGDASARAWVEDAAKAGS